MKNDSFSFIMPRAYDYQVLVLHLACDTEGNFRAENENAWLHLMS